VDGQPLEPCEPAYGSAYGTMIEQAIDALSSGGARVVVAQPPYGRTFGRVQAQDDSYDCIHGIYADAVAHRAAQSALLRLDLFACPTVDTCDSTQVDGRRLRYDGLHYRDAAARAASQWILDQLVQPPT